MTRYTLTIGLFDKDTKKQKFTSEMAIKIVSDLVVDIIGYGTVYQGSGIYTHRNGVTVIEPSIIFFVDGEGIEDKIRSLAWNIKKALNQESVMMEKTVVAMEFV